MSSFLESVMSDIVTIIGAGAVPHAYGKGKLEDRTVGLPRVVWTRADKVPSNIVAPVASATDKLRRLASEQIPLLVHFFALDEDSDDTLIDIEIRALHQKFGSAIFISIASDESNEMIKSFGFYRQMRVNIPRPVYRDPQPTARITGYSLNPAIIVSGAGWMTVEV